MPILPCLKDTSGLSVFTESILQPPSISLKEWYFKIVSANLVVAFPPITSGQWVKLRQLQVHLTSSYLLPPGVRDYVRCLTTLPSSSTHSGEGKCLIAYKPGNVLDSNPHSLKKSARALLSQSQPHPPLHALHAGSHEDVRNPVNSLYTSCCFFY